jgi:hypothetical protein
MWRAKRRSHRFISSVSSRPCSARHLTNIVGAVRRQGAVVRLLLGAGSPRLQGGRQLARCSAPIGPPAIDGQAPRHSREPRSEPIPIAELAEAPERPGKGVLRDLLGIGPVPQHAVGDAEGQARRIAKPLQPDFGSSVVDYAVICSLPSCGAVAMVSAGPNYDSDVAQPDSELRRESGLCHGCCIRRCGPDRLRPTRERRVWLARDAAGRM